MSSPSRKFVGCVERSETQLFAEGGVEENFPFFNPILLSRFKR